MYFGRSITRQQRFGGPENKHLKTGFKVQVFETKTNYSVKKKNEVKTVTSCAGVLGLGPDLLDRTN